MRFIARTFSIVHGSLCFDLKFTAEDDLRVETFIHDTCVDEGNVKFLMLLYCFSSHNNVMFSM